MYRKFEPNTFNIACSYPIVSSFYHADGKEVCKIAFFFC